MVWCGGFINAMQRRVIIPNFVEGRGCNYYSENNEFQPYSVCRRGRRFIQKLFKIYIDIECMYMGTSNADP